MVAGTMSPLKSCPMRTGSSSLPVELAATAMTMPSVSTGSPVLASMWGWQANQRATGRLRVKSRRLVRPPWCWNRHLILYQIEQCPFQLRAYEDFNEGRTNTLHDPTGAELRALEKRMWANAGRALEKRWDEHGVGRAEATKGGTFGGLEEKAYIE